MRHRTEPPLSGPARVPALLRLGNSDLLCASALAVGWVAGIVFEPGFPNFWTLLCALPAMLLVTAGCLAGLPGAAARAAYVSVHLCLIAGCAAACLYAILLFFSIILAGVAVMLTLVAFLVTANSAASIVRALRLR